MDTRNSEAVESAGQRAVQSVEVGGRLLLVLAEHPGPMSLKDLAARAGLPPARAHPYLVSFGRLGLIVQDSSTGRYALGPAALQVGLACLNQCDALRAAEPVAEELARTSGQAVALAVWGNFGPTVVRLVEARQPLHVAIRAGTVMALFGTATGRAFVGALRRERIEQALRGPLGASGLHAAPREFDADIRSAVAELRKHGVTRAAGRPIPGVNAFSAPVRDHTGEPVLVITVFGHQDHMAVDWNSPIADAVRRAAAEVSARVGHRAAGG